MSSIDSGSKDAFEQHVKGLRDIPVDELAVAFDVGDMLEVDDYQRSQANLAKLALNPLPGTFQEKYGVKADMLEDNTSAYDDEGEDLLFEDDLIMRIVAERSKNPSAEMTALFRARRSVVAFILSHWGSIEEQQTLRKPA